MEDYIILSWPEIQELMDFEDFDEYATLIEPNSNLGIQDQTYLVDKDWYEAIQ